MNCSAGLALTTAHFFNALQQCTLYDHTAFYSWTTDCLIPRVTPFLFFGSQTAGEHRGDVPSRADVLSGVTPFTMTSSGSVHRSEDTGTDSWRLRTLFINSTSAPKHKRDLYEFAFLHRKFPFLWR